jgi:hypothetical protein
VPDAERVEHQVVGDRLGLQQVESCIVEPGGQRRHRGVGLDSRPLDARRRSDRHGLERGGRSTDLRLRSSAIVRPQGLVAEAMSGRAR